LNARRFVFTLILAAAVASAVYLWLSARPHSSRSDMNALSERYVRLVLALGQHDPDYVDAYYGPAEWRTEAQHAKVPVAEIEAAATDLAGDLKAITPAPSEVGLPRVRHAFVSRQLESLRARLGMLQGRKLRFDEESQALYDAVAPAHPEEEFLATLARLEQRLPGAGPLTDRYETFRGRFVIPPARLDAAFRAAIDGCRARTLKHVTLPPGENFSVEYVTGKSWSAYNWYKGDYRSVIQVNTDLPIHADTVITLACHEGYPGHHVNNVLLEKNFVRDRKWHELSVYPLFSPQSLIAEGTAEFGVGVAFPVPERRAFARSVIFPAAGLDPAAAEGYYEVAELIRKLGYASAEAARRYLDGQMDAGMTAAWLQTHALQSSKRAAQQIRFFDQYRSYVINYTAGEDLVERWVESRGGTVSNPDRRWELFESLISAPTLPSSLVTPNAQLPTPK
jgi:hypothetical protein